MSERRSKRVSDVKSYDESMDVDDFDDVDEDVDVQDKKPARTAKATQTKRKAANDSDDGEYGKPKKQDKPAAKKKKKGSGRMTGTRVAGRLSMLMDMPVDILTMIYGRLAPIDLLRLARVNKQLRAWLHSEPANVVWVMARKSLVFWRPPEDVKEKDKENPGDITDLYNATRNWEPCLLPDPPEGTTEFDYAFLIFGDKECTTCGVTKKVTFVEYGLGLKLCKPCKKEHMLNKDNAKALLRETFGKKYDKGSLDVTPAQIGKGKHYYDEDLLEWHKVYCRKKQLDDETFEEWVEDRQQIVKDAHELGKTIEKWLPAYKRWGGQVRRQYWDAVRQRHQRRATKLRDFAKNESWWNETLWDGFESGSLGQSLRRQAGEVTLESWTDVQPQVRLEMEQRKAFARTFEEWDSKNPTRDWIYAQFQRDFPDSVGDRRYGLSKGDVLALRSVAPFLLKTGTNSPADAGISLSSDEKLPQSSPAAAWRALWTSRQSDLKKEAQKKQISILSGLCQIVHTAFPDRQPSHQQILEDATLSRKIKIQKLIESLQAPWCLFACSECQRGESYKWTSPGAQLRCLTLAEALKHNHFTTLCQERRFECRASTSEPSYGTSIPTAWRPQRISIPLRLAYAVKLLLDACQLRVQVDAASETETKQASMVKVPCRIEEFDEDWRFECTEKSECTQWNYVVPPGYWPQFDWRRQRGSWRRTIEHVRKHLWEANPHGCGLEKTPSLTSLKVVPKPTP